MKRKIVAMMLIAMMAVNVTACGGSTGSSSSDSKKTESAKEEKKEYVDNIDAVASKPDDYKGKYIKFYGIVSTVEEDDDFY